jgi:hypothetical protein
MRGLSVDSPTFVDDARRLITKYEEHIAGFESVVDLSTFDADRLNSITPHAMAFYGQLLAEAKALGKVIDTKRDAVITTLWEAYTERYAVKLMTKDVERYVLGDARVVEVGELLIAAELVRDKLSAIVSAIEQTSYAVSNVLKYRTAELGAISK